MKIHVSRRALSCLVLAAACWPAPALSAQVCNPETHYAPVSQTLRSYTGDQETGADSSNSIAHHCNQVYRVFLPPTGAAPPNGWPVLIAGSLGGFSGSEVNTCVAKGTFNAKLLEAGIAVVIAGMTVSTASIPCPGGGSQTIDGHGLFHPPGLVPPDLAFAPYDDPDYAMPEKDAVMIVQHVRRWAGTQHHPLAAIDPERIAVHSHSAGAISLMWGAFGPDRRGEEPFLSLGGQFDEPTRPDVAVLRGGTVWWPIFHPDMELGSTSVLHFGDDGHSETAAASIGDCSKDELQAGSALFYEAVFPEPSLPVLLDHGEPSYCRDYSSNGPTADYDYSFTCGGLEGIDDVFEPECGLDPGGVHPSWNGYLWKELHQASARLVIHHEDTFDCEGQADCGGEDGCSSCSSPAVEAEEPAPGLTLDEHLVAWLVERMADLPNTWSIFEHIVMPSGACAGKRRIGVRGVDGVPQLVGAGALGSGSTLALTHAKPSTATYLFVNVTTSPACFNGGILIPSTGFDPLVVFTDGAGQWTAETDGLLESDPPFDPGTPIWFQVWLPDDAAPSDVAGSNAVRVIIP